mmetsp:Transcript_14526/g.18969  ORF Transcript_14526/g.18969 Transcript_14526/m.18969 type:complete len:232 (+) Transcript_14526:1894-2589(+)
MALPRRHNNTSSLILQPHRAMDPLIQQPVPAPVSKIMTTIIITKTRLDYRQACRECPTTLLYFTGNNPIWDSTKVNLGTTMATPNLEVQSKEVLDTLLQWAIQADMAMGHTLRNKVALTKDRAVTRRIVVEDTEAAAATTTTTETSTKTNTIRSNTVVGMVASLMAQWVTMVIFHVVATPNLAACKTITCSNNSKLKLRLGASKMTTSTRARKEVEHAVGISNSSLVLLLT